MGGVKSKIMSFFKTNTTKNYSKATRANNVDGGQKKPRKSKIKKTIRRQNVKAIETKRVRYIKKLFEQEEDFDKPVRLGNFYNNNCIEYESNGDRNKTL